MKMKMNALALALTSLSMVSVGAQTHNSMPAMDHSKMDHGSMGTATPTPVPATTPMPGMRTQTAPAVVDRSGMGTTAPANTAAAAMPGMSTQPGADAGMAGMDHGSTDTQGGTAPADARDPHAYSGGFTLASGPYALSGTRQLRLADEHNFGALIFNRLERVYTKDGTAAAYDAQAWFGRDYDRLVIKAEGEVSEGKLHEARTEVLWGHAIAPFWDTQLGLRYDSGGTAPQRTWLALGVQGLAPYWFEVDAVAYLGENGKTAFRLGGEYEILLTQKLILQPRAEVNIYGQDDVQREIGAGLANGVAGLRLRYEINRQFAPYLGVERSSKLGKTADMAREAGAATSETRWVAGVRVWF